MKTAMLYESDLDLKLANPTECFNVRNKKFPETIWLADRLDPFQDDAFDGPKFRIFRLVESNRRRGIYMLEGVE